jgi:hypothetical protein
MRADAADHHHHEGAIVHVHPVRAANEFIRGVANKGTIWINREVRLIKSSHRHTFVCSLYDSLDVPAVMVLERAVQLLVNIG